MLLVFKNYELIQLKRDEFPLFLLIDEVRLSKENIYFSGHLVSSHMEITENFFHPSIEWE